MSTIHFKRASEAAELKQILALQRNNIATSITPNEKQQEGFVTVQHSEALMAKMNDAAPHIIAKSGNFVVGYALVMLSSFRNEVAVLLPMFEKIDSLLPLHSNYVVMGQICVAKEFRKQGIFRGMYTFYKQELHTKFDYLVTEIDATNIRSMKAHEAVGFKTKASYLQDGVLWNIVIWDWR
jgi:predicted GNAT superfamily acetyltransferase